MMKLSEVQSGAVVAFPENSYDRGTVYIKTNVGYDLSLSDGGKTHICYMVAVGSRYDDSGILLGEINAFNENEEVKVLDIDFVKMAVEQ